MSDRPATPLMLLTGLLLLSGGVIAGYLMASPDGPVAWIVAVLVVAPGLGGLALLPRVLRRVNEPHAGAAAPGPEDRRDFLYSRAARRAWGAALLATTLVVVLLGRGALPGGCWGWRPPPCWPASGGRCASPTTGRSSP